MSRLRHETKYRINVCDKAIIETKIKGVSDKDSHTDNTNKYVVRSLYLDNLNDDILYSNINGVDNRVKYRIRYYNNDLSYIKLEKKTKYRNMGNKESCRLSIDECKAIINGQIPKVDADDEIKKRLLNEIKEKGLLPKVIITYTRTPYIYKIGNVRVTFDEDITSSIDISNFLKGQYIDRPIMKIGELILEVKWNELLPRDIKDIIMLNNLTLQAFSKYYMCRLIKI